VNSKSMPAPGPELILWVRERNPHRPGESMTAYRDRLKVAYHAAKARWERLNPKTDQVPA